MNQEFHIYSDIQAYVETTLPTSKEDLFINVDDKNVQFDIHENDESKGIAIIKRENVQKIFDWLKSKGVVK